MKPVRNKLKFRRQNAKEKEYLSLTKSTTSHDGKQQVEMHLLSSMSVRNIF